MNRGPLDLQSNALPLSYTPTADGQLTVFVWTVRTVQLREKSSICFIISLFEGIKRLFKGVKILKRGFNPFKGKN